MIQTVSTLSKRKCKQILKLNLHFLSKMLNISKKELKKLSKKENNKFNLAKKYKINHCGIWNNPKDLGKEGIIYIKNNRFAIIYFPYKKRSKIDLEDLYRLEDLTVTDIDIK